MNFRLKRWLRYIVCLVIVLILCWQSSGSSERLTNCAKNAVIGVTSFFGLKIKTEGLYLLVRKTGHGIAFCALSFFGHLAISGDADDFKTIIIWSSIINFGFALLAEIFQAYTAGRSPTFVDGFINLAGAAAGILLAMLIESIAVKRRAAQHL